MIASVDAFGDLQEDVVGQGAGPETKHVRREPVVPEGFVDHDQIVQRLLGRADATGRLHADADARGEEEFADGVEHDQSDRQRGSRTDLARRRLDEIPPGLHGNHAGRADIVISDQFTSLENDLQMDVTAKLFHRGDFIVHLGILAAQKGRTVDDHVDLIGAGVERDAGVFKLGFERGLSAREIGGHGGDFDRRTAQEGFGCGHEVWIDADRGDRPHPVALGCRVHGLVAEGHHFARRVPSLEGCQVEHGEGQPQTLHLGLRFDAALGERRGALFDHDLVDASKRRRLPRHGKEGTHEKRKISRRN